MKIAIQCESCEGTGVYRGFAEGEGEGVVCINCRGTGCRELSYTPFTKRKRRKDVKTVSISRGTFIGIGVGPVGNSVSYSEFLEGRMPS